MCVTWVIIRKPTTTSAAAAASNGTTVTSGAKNIASRNSTPVTRLAKPVRAPSATPAALLDVGRCCDEMLRRAAGRRRDRVDQQDLLGCAAACRPRRASRPRAPTPTIVPIVSKKSVSSSVKTSSRAATTPIGLRSAPNRSNVPEQRRGRAWPTTGGRQRRHVEAPAVRVRPRRRPTGGPTLRDRLDDDRQDRARDDADQDRALDLARDQHRGEQQAEDEHEDRPADERAADAEADERRAAPVARTKPASTKPMMRDEQADADADRGLQLRRARRGTRPCGTRSAPGCAMITPSRTTRPIASAQVICGAIVERDERVDAQPGGEREREPADDAHQDRHARPPPARSPPRPARSTDDVPPPMNVRSRPSPYRG